MIPKLEIYVARLNYGKNLYEELESIFWLEVLQHGGLYRCPIG